MYAAPIRVESNAKSNERRRPQGGLGYHSATDPRTAYFACSGRTNDAYFDDWLAMIGFAARPPTRPSRLQPPDQCPERTTAFGTCSMEEGLVKAGKLYIEGKNRD
jgi:hypothetical protein